ncbi:MULTISPECIES: aspartate kinase [unclassified Actinomyces]|uniref:aspartate kinase n=1 Tax=unclassified Actinomyces TaxID=2609248 RepID=UPI0020171485|nr:MULTISPECIES: aspartate kinase [unclassified Actinomyces]MCL3778477.1 aspartate kinase [Actinomyces sp. AC-20-1]MCL3790397.1 aspartate kinase [Actinomyces sp. 187325]MCL3792632.1 aspartate kinase [Actinomyces sp. 186855]MCL3793965.1 aspartate kinase [Actinomyces sp. 217892]
MALVVQKYGGSSVSDVEAMRRVAKRVVATRKAGNTAVVVVSAMGDTTDELLDMADALTSDAPGREMDILLSAGERISMSLLAMAINELGVPARAYTGAQAGVLTDSKYGKASIVGVLPERVARAIQMGAVAVVAGFQGINEVEDVTTLGRGGSDTTAVALAAALNADVCEIYTDVDGLFSADPRIVPSAHRIESLTSEETLEMAANGAKILHLRAVEYARRFGVPIHVRSSFSDKTGTWIVDGSREDRPAIPAVAAHLDKVLDDDPEDHPAERGGRRPARSLSALGVATVDAVTGTVVAPEGAEQPSATLVDEAHQTAIATRAQARTRTSAKENNVEAPVISGIAHDRSQDKITLVGVPDVPGAAARIFAIVAGAETNIDMIVQDVSASGSNLTNISFTCPDGDSAAAREALEAAQDELGFAALEFNPNIGKLSLVGAGMRSHPGVSARLFSALSEAGVNIQMISTSEIRISVVVDDAVLDEAVRAVHTAFGLDASTAEAVVYGGTGR